jgi:hypothetical protein
MLHFDAVRIDCHHVGAISWREFAQPIAETKEMRWVGRSET